MTIGFISLRRVGQATVCVLLGMAAQSWAQAPGADDAARHLVRTIIHHELEAEQADHTHWMYLDRIREPGKDEVKEVVETSAVKLEMLTALNGHPLPPEERQREIARLEKEASDSDALENARRTEHEDGENARRMLKMLPDAFLYEIKRQEGDRVILSFRPDPSYQPSTREAAVFHAMAGMMALNTKEQRLEELSGHLANEVKFGWGVLGRLDKGGQFRVKQDEVTPGHWQVCELDVQISGKALFFKSISLHQRESRSEFRQVPGDLGPQRAVNMLATQPVTVAQSGK